MQQSKLKSVGGGASSLHVDFSLKTLHQESVSRSEMLINPDWFSRNDKNELFITDTSVIK